MKNIWQEIATNKFTDYESAKKKYEFHCMRYKIESGTNWKCVNRDCEDDIKHLSLKEKDILFKVIEKGHIQKIKYYINEALNYIVAILLINHKNKDYSVSLYMYNY